MRFSPFWLNIRMPESILGDWSTALVRKLSQSQCLVLVPFVLGASPRRDYCLVLAISDILRGCEMLADIKSRCLMGKSDSHNFLVTRELRVMNRFFWFQYIHRYITGLLQRHVTAKYNVKGGPLQKNPGLQ